MSKEVLQKIVDGNIIEDSESLLKEVAYEKSK